MNLRHRDGLGQFLNEAGLTGAGVEVGSGDGAFAMTVLADWRGRELTLVGSWSPQGHPNTAPGHADAHAAALRLAQAGGRVRLCPDDSPTAAARFADGSLDFAYLSGDPAYLAVTADLETWYPKVAPGGLIAGSGYLDGIVGGRLFGVRTAVDQFARGRGTAAAFTVGDGPFAGWYVRKPLGPVPRPHRVTVLTAFDAGYATVGAISRAK